MTFQPGQSGNPGGRKKEKPWRDALNLALNDGDGKRLRKIAEKVVELAEKGDPTAYKEIAERLEGKVPQAQIHQGDEDGGPVRVTRIEIVAAPVDDSANPTSP